MYYIFGHEFGYLGYLTTTLFLSIFGWMVSDIHIWNGHRTQSRTRILVLLFRVLFVNGETTNSNYCPCGDGPSILHQS